MCTDMHTIAMCKNYILHIETVKDPGGETFCQLLK